MSRSPNEQLSHFVSDLYSMELQALAQLKSAPDNAGDASLAHAFRAHYTETERQAEVMRARLEELGESPSRIKDALMKLGGKGFLLFAKAQSETPGRLVAHAYAYEAMEWAGYGLLSRMATVLGDRQTTDIAKSIQAEERAMMKRLERGFDAAEDASHGDAPTDELKDHIVDHLTEVHALVNQSIELLEKRVAKSAEVELHKLYDEHLGRARAIRILVEERLQALGSKPSTFKDAAMKMGGLNWNAFLQAQSDHPTKLLAFIYAVGHLKIAGYELLRRTARRAGDLETDQLCQAILQEERTMASELESSMDIAVSSTLLTVQT